MQDQRKSIPEDASAVYYEDVVEVPTQVETSTIGTRGREDTQTETEREGPTLIRRKHYVTEDREVLLAPPPAGGPLLAPIRLRERRPKWRSRLIPALLLLTALAALWYFASAPRTYVEEPGGKVWKLPPGSKLGNWYLPFIGEILDFMNSPFSFGLDHAKDYGPVSYSNVLWQDTIVLSGRALTDFYNNTNIGRRGAYPMHVVDLMGGEILPMLDEPLHSQRRDWLQKAFGPGFTEDYLYKAEGIIKEAVVDWETMKRFHWVPEFRRLTSRLAGSLLFNDPDGGEIHRKHFEEIIAAMTSIPWSLPGSNYRNGENARYELFEWYMNYAAQQGDSKAGLEIGRILSRDNRGATISLNNGIREMHHLALSIYAIHNVLAFSVQALSQHQDVWNRAKAEVEQVTPIGEITLEKLQQLPYLGQLVDEVRRYYPIFPGLFGYVKQGFSIDGNYLPKDAIVFASLYAANHDPTLFDNPDIFDPSRFYEGFKETRVEKPFNYYSHGAGGIGHLGRHCLGEDLTSSITKIALIHLLRNYSWTLTPQNLTPKMDLLLPVPKSGLMVHGFMQSDQPIKADYL